MTRPITTCFIKELDKYVKNRKPIQFQNKRLKFSHGNALLFLNLADANFCGMCCRKLYAELEEAHSWYSKLIHLFQVLKHTVILLYPKTCLARALLFENRHFLKKYAEIHPWLCNTVAEPGSFIWFGIDNFPAKERKKENKKFNWTLDESTFICFSRYLLSTYCWPRSLVKPCAEVNKPNSAPRSSNAKSRDIGWTTSYTITQLQQATGWGRGIGFGHLWKSHLKLKSG